MPEKKKNPFEDISPTYTPEEWSNIFGLEIIDPDGWRHEKIPFENKISFEGYRRLQLRSTIKIINSFRFQKFCELASKYPDWKYNFQVSSEFISELRVFFEAGDWKMLACELDKFLRDKLKYVDLSEEAEAIFQECRDKLYEELRSRSLCLYE